MNKKILITIGIFGLIIAAIVFFLGFQKPEKPWECKTDEDCKLVRCKGVYCDNGICKCPPGRIGDISRVKVASVYQKVTDGKLIDRSVDDVVGFFKETKTDFIFRGFWIWGPCANKCSDLPPEVLEVHKQKGFDCEEEGYSYTHLKDAITKIKREMPDVIFCGAIPAQRINFIEINPMTGKVYNQQETDSMALDPAKWGITDVSKNQLQKYFQERGTGEMGYFPDITNLEFQELFLSWAKKQIDCGADAIWIDALFGQVRALEEITGNSNHPAVRESFQETSKMVDEIHKYGQSKGKHIYVGTWWAFVELPYPPPNFDFVTVTPSPEEVSSMHLDESKWDERIEKIRDKQSNTPVFAFIDWAGTTNTPLGRFSQGLTPDEQREFLKIADEFFQEKGITFVYPIHGGFMGQEATILSFGRSKTYDSLAPEFQTYETIKELAQNRGQSSVPQRFQLFQNYPNPFNPQTVISYQLPARANVTIKIYDVLGQELRTLVNENQSAGHHSVVWDGKDKFGESMCSGIYFYQLKMDNPDLSGQTKKLLLLK